MFKKLFQATKDLLGDGQPLKVAASTPLNASQQWVLALGSLLNAKEGHSQNTLPTGSDSDSLRYGLTEVWGIADRGEFLQAAERLSSLPNQGDYEAMWGEMRKIAGIDAAPSGGGMAGLMGGMSKFLDISNPALVNQGVNALLGRVDEDKNSLYLKLSECSKWIPSLETLEVQGAQVRNLMAWDISRLTNVARWAHQLGWISEQEYFQICTPLAQQVQSSYNSWQDYSAAVYVASMIWKYEEQRNDDFVASYQRLFKDPQSPLVKLAWKTLL
jgi:hypothetical protein